MAVQFDLVSPERRLASVSATEVQIPGADGDLTAMAGHAATITTLRPGVLRAVSGGAVKSYLVTGGFAEISANAVTVLAERAVSVDEASTEELDQITADVRAAAELSSDKDAAAKAVSDLALARGAIGR